ncbi:MAG: alkaline phosphatase family protein [Cellvibrionaceae bacterium]|nr:alkaline phosphatase family protein [Cellvibrionaceae bacterium]
MLKRRLKHLIGLASILAASVVAAQPSVVVIGVDGMGASGFDRADTPVMNKLLSQGWFSDNARVVFKTSSGPNWASLLSGLGPEQHGVLDNAWRPGKSPIPPTVSNQIGGFLTIMDYAANAYPKRPRSAIYGWSEFDYLLGTAPMSKQYFAASGDNAAEKMAAEIEVTKKTGRAAAAALKQSPALLFVQFDMVDHALHTFGVDSAEYLQSITRVDTAIGEIITELSDEDTVIITADHGGKATQHGGYTVDEQEVPMIISGPRTRGGKRIQAPVHIYDTACTSLDAMGVAIPVHMICKSLLNPALVKASAGSRTERLPRPAVYQAASRPKQISLTVDHPEANIFYRLSEGLTMGKWLPYRGPFELELPQRIEAESRLGEHRSRIYGNDLLLPNNGVSAELFAGNWNTLPDFAVLEPLAKFTIGDFSLGLLPYPKEYFGVRFQSQFIAPLKGTYTFRIKVDDGGAVYVNGQRLAHEPEPKGSRFAEGTIELPAGPAKLDLRYYQTYGSIALQLDVKAPGASDYQAIPAASLLLP